MIIKCHTVAGPLVLLASLALGCNLNRLAADQSVELAEAGADGFNGFWDYEIFGQAVPSAILQSEALVHINPDNEKLLLGLARIYVSYTYGWVQDEWERADDAADFEKADELERRVKLLYDRAAKLALKAVHMRDREKNLESVLKTGKTDRLRDYLRAHYTEQEDVPALYWTGLAWGSAIANSGGDMNELADAPLARSFMERSIELDPSYADAGGLAVLGTVEASFPELFGGNLDLSKQYYERALKVSERRNHLILLSYAKIYAVARQDRELFVSLLREILDAPDQGNDLRISNKIARHRARRYIRKVDDWFDPALAPAPDAP